MAIATRRKISLSLVSEDRKSILMETRFLDTFLLVAELGSLAEASRRLGITPAAVAQRMQALEDDVGVPLLTRVGRRVRPTDTGHAIIEKSRTILAEVRDLRSLANADLPSGELRLGAITTALTGLLPAALHEVFASMPHVEVFLLPGPSTDLYQRLMDRDIDAAILVKPPFSIPKTLEWELLRAERLVLVAPADCRGENPHQLLKTRPFIRYDRNNWGGRLADEYLQKQGLKPAERLELDSLEAISVMVANGLGISLVPDLARPWPEGLNIAVLELPVPFPPREVGMLWPRSSPSRRLTRIVLDALKRSQTAIRR
jgi:DNA-binding transcriptional LysR family regulator